MVDCIVTHRIIKGKVYAVMRDKYHNEDQLLASEFRSIAQLKRIAKDAKIMYCRPETFNIAKHWVK